MHKIQLLFSYQLYCKKYSRRFGSFEINKAGVEKLKNSLDKALDT